VGFNCNHLGLIRVLLGVVEEVVGFRGSAGGGMAGTGVNVWMILGEEGGCKVRTGDGEDVKHHPHHYYRASSVLYYPSYKHTVSHKHHTGGVDSVREGNEALPDVSR